MIKKIFSVLHFYHMSRVHNTDQVRKTVGFISVVCHQNGWTGKFLQKIQNLMLEVMRQNEKVLKDPAPFARLSGGTNEAMQFTARAWCKTEDYWDVYFDLTQAITEKLGESGVQAPAVRVISEK